MKNTDEFYELFIKQLKSNKKESGYSEYGSSVMPILEEYKNIKTYEERVNFQKALEKILQDQNSENRSFGVTICLGFYVFRDVI